MRFCRFTLSIALLATALSACRTARPAGPSPGGAVLQPQFIALSVADLEGTAEWYRQTLNLREVSRATSPDGKSRNVMLGNDVLLLEMVQNRDAKPLGVAAPGLTRPWQIHGIFKTGFFVDDLDGWIERLDRKGVKPFGHVIENPEIGMRSILFRDPEGNVFQLFERMGKGR